MMWISPPPLNVRGRAVKLSARQFAMVRGAAMVQQRRHRFLQQLAEYLERRVPFDDA
jgi:hypothetical protein